MRQVLCVQMLKLPLPDKPEYQDIRYLSLTNNTTDLISDYENK